MQYEARRPIKFGSETIQMGRVVPGAQHWDRLQSWISTGRLKPARSMEEAMEEPEPLPEETDNSEREEDPPQDVSQDPNEDLSDGPVVTA